MMVSVPDGKTEKKHSRAFFFAFFLSSFFFEFFASSLQFFHHAFYIFNPSVGSETNTFDWNLLVLVLANGAVFVKEQHNVPTGGNVLKCPQKDE